MRCYTRSSGKTTTGIVINGKNQKTCAINLNIPYDWDDVGYIQHLRDKSLADILLYGCTELVNGDSCSSVFPEDCVLIRFMDISDVENINNSCMELNLSAESVDLILYEDSCLFDESTKTYLINSKGKIVEQSEPPNRGSQMLEIENNGDFEISL